jgi:putative ABC transport system substrate-binding protein
MRRRQFIILAGCTAASTLIARAQQHNSSMRRIGLLVGIADDPEGQTRVAAFVKRLSELGWMVGKNVEIDVRWAGGSPDRIAANAAELAALAPDVIVGTSTPVTAALHRAVQSIPIVFAVVTDPVGNGFITNLRRPEGNITGFTNFEISMGGKWIEKLKEIAPRTARVGIVFNPANSPEVRAYYGPSVEAAAVSLTVKTIDIPIHDDVEIERALVAFGREPDGGLIVLPDNTTVRYRERIAALANEHSLPAVYPYRYFATSGGLLSYGIDTVDLYSRSATYVDRILRGAKPADLPVQQPTKFEVVINLKTAKAIKLDVPDSLLVTANEVIE